MLNGIFDAMTEKLPPWTGLTYALVIAVGVGVGAVPLLNQADDLNSCNQAMAKVSDFQSFDIAYAECEARGIVRRN
ncbi:hypothetical protein [Stenotrophomonas rhizophila]